MENKFREFDDPEEMDFDIKSTNRKASTQEENSCPNDKEDDEIIDYSEYFLVNRLKAMRNLRDSVAENDYKINEFGEIIRENNK